MTFVLSFLLLKRHRDGGIAGRDDTAGVIRLAVVTRRRERAARAAREARLVVVETAVGQTNGAAQIGLNATL